MCLIAVSKNVDKENQPNYAAEKENNAFVEKLLLTLSKEDTHESAVECVNETDNDVDETATVVFQPEGHPKQAEIDAEIWPPTFEAENVRSAKRMQLCGTDTFVCTYPKCGTTWIQHICSQLLFPEQYGENADKELCFTSPMIERMGAQFCAGLCHPRLLKTHFTWPNCPKSRRSKYIFAARNPKDCLVSYFHHHRNFRCYQWTNGDFDLFFELFIAGRLGFGDYFDHLLSWLPHIHEANVLFLKYEDMLADLEDAVQRIGTFLGGEAAKIVQNAEQLERVVVASRMEAMRSNGKFFPANALQNNANFIRKGCARDWKNWLSREQSDRLDVLFRRKMAGTEAEGWWQREMQWDEQTVEQEDTSQNQNRKFAEPRGY